jgi:hypothetical protein
LLSGLALLAAFACAGPARAAFTWAESGSAGALPSTAQTVLGSGSLDLISGSLSVASTVAASNLVDLYLISLTGGSFTATTVGQKGTISDTELFLFDSQGRGVAFNDDASATDHRSTLSLSGVAAGNYYLGVAFFDVEPRAAGGVNIFNPSSANRTQVLSASTSLPVTDYLVGTGGLPAQGTYTYEIALTGASGAVPAPGGLLLAGVGGGCLLLFRSCRRRRPQP